MGKYANYLTGFLTDSDADIRKLAAQALGDIREYVPDIEVAQIGELLEHQNERFRSAAATAVGLLGPKKAGAYAQDLKTMLENDGLVPKCAAAVALGRFGIEANHLAPLLRSQSLDLRSAACEALSEMDGANLIDYISEFTRLLRDANPSIRNFAQVSLQKLEAAGQHLDTTTQRQIEGAQIRGEERCCPDCGDIMQWSDIFLAQWACNNRDFGQHSTTTQPWRWFCRSCMCNLCEACCKVLQSQPRRVAQTTAAIADAIIEQTAVAGVKMQANKTNDPEKIQLQAEAEALKMRIEEVKAMRGRIQRGGIELPQGMMPFCRHSSGPLVSFFPGLRG